mmetsp:Transcript_9058/g.10055  ORF Transcript_9058/g.10055 Transcript_9058/m.10055 type:complete len:481 (+) Transcript_9058:166-1608(+)|eukprot:CAMPEP_0168533134 /NCGR_PEP_ID=MMETSP0405-20121227/16835_1 /TAXON_ID=498012 /ORGANISM="Trichosphaerium sp, Strain Am-I-7 wt" /LENGTH=480 /DNA_ID=CAMNT_0008559015 /DNA_START=93 /DNA_END=1535 /DNA_ORIENTATION=+
MTTSESNAAPAFPESRLEGRETVESRLQTWFKQSKWDLELTQMEHKGYGMTGSGDAKSGEIVMLCEPFVFVPYEPRKNNVCAHCFRKFGDDPEGLNDGYNTESTASSMKAPSTVKGKGKAKQSQPPKRDLPDLPEGVEPAVIEKPVDVWAELPIDPIQSASRQLWYCCGKCKELDKDEHEGYELAALSALDTEWVKEYYGLCDDLLTDVRLLIRAMNKRQIARDKKEADPSIEVDSFTEQYAHLISNKECYDPDTLQTLMSIVRVANWLMPEKARMDEDDLLEMYCQHRVNMFGIWGDTGECLGYGVYPRASFFNHSCWPNATFGRCKTQLSPFMEFTSVYDIAKDAEVCISYIDISTGLKDRRECLSDKYFFVCKCDRCVYQEQYPELIDPYYDPQYYSDEGVKDDGAPTDQVPEEHGVTLGQSVRLYWPLYNTWYKGVIIKYRKDEDSYLIKYDDGEWIWEKWQEKTWHLKDEEEEEH